MSPPAPGHRIPLRLPSRQAKAPLPSSSRHRTGRRAGSSDPPGRTMMRLTVPEDRPQNHADLLRPHIGFLHCQLRGGKLQFTLALLPALLPAHRSESVCEKYSPSGPSFSFSPTIAALPRYRRLWQTRCSAFLSSVSSANSSVFLFCVLPFLTFSISVFSILTHDFPVLGNSVRCSTKILFQKLLEECFS